MPVFGETLHINPFMKKSLSLLLVLCTAVVAHAQFASQVIFQHYFTKPQIDSILAAQGVPSGILTTVYPVKTYKVIYNTVAADSTPTTASGLLVVPQGTPCDVPMLSYQHNNVFRRNDAPSNYKYEWFIGLAGGSLGLITMLPDGLGLGSGPGDHPFLQLQSEATPVVDMLRAVRETVDTMGAAYNQQLFLAGIAEGAYATVAANQYIQTYLPQIQVTGAGAIAGYYDLSGTMQNEMILSNNNYNDPSYLAALFLSYNRIYHYAASDSDIFVTPYDSILPAQYNGTREAYQINGVMPSVPNQVLQQAVIDTLQNDPNNYFTQLLRKNDAYNWTPNNPIKLFFCTADEIIPWHHTAVAYSHFVSNGAVTVDTLNVGSTYDHNLCGQFSTLAAISAIRGLIFEPMVAHTSSTQASSASAADGSASVHDTLGNPPYHWVWSNGDTTSSISGLNAGVYYVTTTDQSHCSRTDSVRVSFVNGINDIAAASISVYPNPAHDRIIVDYTQASEQPVNIELLDIGGHSLLSTAAGAGGTTVLDLSDRARGVYIIRIRTTAGSELHSKIVLL